MNEIMNNIENTKKILPSKLFKIGLALLAAGLVIVITAFFTNTARSAFNNLIMLMFLSSVGVGSLFLVGIEYLGGAVWSTPMRRISEFLASIILVLPIIALPSYFNLHDLFHWTHVSAVQSDEILSKKAPYLNVTFFTVRVVIIFALWILFYYLITRTSKQQDKTKDQKLTTRNTVISAVFMPVLAFTITFASIDWIMSLEAHWFSSIFGVYYFSGSVLAALGVGTFLIVLLNEKGYLTKKIKKDHYYSLGALLFAFTNFWAYIAFSQFMLIWYGNLPEETSWFLHRWEGTWMYLSIALIFVHFIIPYFGLLSQPSKKHPKRLLFFSAWIVFAHILDLYWMIMPAFDNSGIVFGWVELGFPLVAFGILLLLFGLKVKKENIIPIGDPKLKRGFEFRL